MKLKKYSLEQLSQTKPVLNPDEESLLVGGASRISNDLAVLNYSEMLQVYGQFPDFPSGSINGSSEGAIISDLMAIIQEAAFFDNSLYSIIESGTIDWSAYYSNSIAQANGNQYFEGKTFTVSYSQVIETPAGMALSWIDERDSRPEVETLSSSIATNIASLYGIILTETSRRNLEQYIVSHLNSNYSYDNVRANLYQESSVSCSVTIVDNSSQLELFSFNVYVPDYE